jgi:capsular exopolysaccharide synthesis family protein
LEVREYLNLLRRWWWLVVLLAIVGAVLGYVLTPEPAPQYRSTVKLLLNQGQGTETSAIAVRNAQSQASTYHELMRSRPVLTQVNSNLGLNLEPGVLANKITVEWVTSTNLISLTVIDSDAMRASQIANEVVRVFIEQNTLLQASRYEASKESIQAELAQIQTDLEVAQFETLQMERDLDRIQNALLALDQLEEEQGSLTAAQTEQRNQLDTQLAQQLVVSDASRLRLSNLQTRQQTLLNSYEEVRRLEAQSGTVMSIVEEALPGVRVNRQSKKVTNSLQAILAGLVTGLGIIALMEYFRVSVKSSEEITKATGLSTLGIISDLKASTPAKRLVTASEPRSAKAEAYRVLRANIEFAAGDVPIRTIVVTSSVPVEGKTTTSANLATAIAQSGKRVLLVDTDLRRPSLHKLFEMPNARGVTTALLDETTNLEDHWLTTQVENLYLMPSGPLPPNPADLLGSSQMTDLIERLKQCVDVIVFDTPPALVVADSSLLARKSDVTVLVVLAGSTSVELLRKAHDQLSQSGANLLGVILNRIKSNENGYYYYYGHKS